MNLTIDEIEDSKIKSPYIIARGENKKSISQFNLCIESEIIPLPVEFNIIDAIDILFKSHYVFNQNFNDCLANFWIFFSYYIYKIVSNKNIPIRIQEIGNKIDTKSLNM